MTSRLDAKHEKILKGLLKEADNRACANCGSLGPQYVVTDFNIFVCSICSGVHREFNHRCKGITMATFKPDEVVAVQQGGNAVALAQYLAKWSPRDLPKPTDRRPDQIKSWIDAVYKQKRFYDSSGFVVPARPVTRTSSAGSSRGSEIRVAEIPVARPVSELLGSEPIRLQVTPSNSAVNSPTAGGAARAQAQANSSLPSGTSNGSNAYQRACRISRASDTDSAAAASSHAAAATDATTAASISTACAGFVLGSAPQQPAQRPPQQPPQQEQPKPAMKELPSDLFTEFKAPPPGMFMPPHAAQMYAGAYGARPGQPTPYGTPMQSPQGGAGGLQQQNGPFPGAGFPPHQQHMYGPSGFPQAAAASVADPFSGIVPGLRSALPQVQQQQQAPAFPSAFAQHPAHVAQGATPAASPARGSMFSSDLGQGSFDAQQGGSAAVKSGNPFA
ncbi:hypothetical protein WJX73_000451 [Symbiochloris irregularis]|uniref:Arf-GAP domain-containing protein n=1 Tax=Symbiochloris irregularis TaxID=706552 RepID=A0AAW1NZD7_9CHLO